MSLSDKIIQNEIFIDGIFKSEDVREAVKDLKREFCGRNQVAREINEKIIKEIFGEKLIK